MEDIYRFKNLESDSARIGNLARQLVRDYYVSSRILIGKSLLVDKEPLEPVALPSKKYERFLVNVRRLFPESKILLAIRDPVATISSMSQRTWGDSLSSMETRNFTIEEYAHNWCSCADLILRYFSDPRTYIVQFGRLMNDSTNESKRILDFLSIPNGGSFEPRRTSDISFNEEETDRILRLVQPQLDLLDAQRISDLK
jgi:hypothetical protein